MASLSISPLSVPPSSSLQQKHPCLGGSRRTLRCGEVPLLGGGAGRLSWFGLSDSKLLPVILSAGAHFPHLPWANPCETATTTQSGPRVRGKDSQALPGESLQFPANGTGGEEGSRTRRTASLQAWSRVEKAGSILHVLVCETEPECVRDLARATQLGSRTGLRRG